MSKATRRGGFTGRIERGPMAADVIESHFTRVFNAALRDRRLSRRARGLLAEMLSHRDGFGISMAALLANGPEREHALTSALHELELYGYLKRDRERRDDGTLGDTIFWITDMPDGLLIGAQAPWEKPEAPAEENRRSEPDRENPGLDADSENRRSEPDRDFPSQAKPGLDNQAHKKNTSSSSGGEEDSLPSAADQADPMTVAEDTGEREALSKTTNEPLRGKPSAAASRSEERRDARPAGRTGESEVSDAALAVTHAWSDARRAAGHPAPKSLRTRIARQAHELLTDPEEPADVERLTAAAVSMAAKATWLDLVMHYASADVRPTRSAAPKVREGYCPRHPHIWIGDDGSCTTCTPQPTSNGMARSVLDAARAQLAQRDAGRAVDDAHALT